MEPVQIIELGSLVVLILLSGFFSGSETAFMSLNRVKIREKKLKGDKSAKRVDQLLSKPGKLLTTILVGNNLVNIASSAIATTLALEFFGEKGPWIATISMTVLVLIFGEITPKTYANQDSEKLASFSATYLIWLSKIFNPLIKVLIAFTNRLIKIVGGDPDKQKPFVTEDEIIRFVTVGEREGVIEEKEKEMIHSVFEFDDTLAREVMVPRIDIISMSINTPLDVAVDLVMEKGHSRIPVFRNTIDNIVGILYAKDLLCFIKKDFKDESIGNIMRKAYYVPESKKIDELLSEMKTKKIHMAIVLDEYGGTAGIVTIEDLIEEIVGDIKDEYDIEDVEYRFLNEKELIVDARVTIDELDDLIGRTLPANDYDTLGGMVLSYLGHVPEVDESIILNDLKITVEEMAGNRILKLRIKIQSPDQVVEAKEDQD